MKKILHILLLLTLSQPLLASEMSLIGKGMLEYSIFKVDIYEISYLKGARKGVQLEELILEYKTNVKKKYSNLGWKEGLDPLLKEDPSLKKQAKWITDQTEDMSKGDKFIIRKNIEEKSVTLLKNDKTLGTSKDPKVYEIVFETWIGKTPVDQDLKNKLLKNLKK